MKSQDRIHFLTEAFAALCESGQERSFITFENADAPDEYVQFMLHRGGVHGEVGSGMWVDPPRPLGSDAVLGLALLGFTGGGPERNYSNDALPRDAAELARMADAAFGAAYGRGVDVDLVATSNDLVVQRYLRGAGRWQRECAPQSRVEEVKLLRRDDVAGVLRDRGLKYFSYGDDDLMAYWYYKEETGTEIKVHFNVEEEGTVYRVVGMGDRPVAAVERARMLNLCNEWNSHHRWPKAYLWDDEHDGDVFCWIELSMDLPARAGLHHALLDDFTDTAITSIHEFFAWLRERRGEPGDVAAEAA